MPVPEKDVHSYCAEPRDLGVVAGTTEYGGSFCSALVRGNLMATQFHPEKSGENGLRMYENFLRLASVTGRHWTGGRTRS